MLKTTKKVLSAINEALFGMSAVSLTLLTVIAVFFRFVLNKPIKWCEEVQMILVVWSVFFGSSIAIQEKGHIAVDIIFDTFSPIVRQIWSIVIWWIVFVSIVIIGKLEINRTLDLIKTSLRTPVLHIPSYIEYAVVVFACLLILIGHFINGVEIIKGKIETRRQQYE